MKNKKILIFFRAALGDFYLNFPLFDKDTIIVVDSKIAMISTINTCCCATPAHTTPVLIRLAQVLVASPRSAVYTLTLAKSFFINIVLNP